jgi:hypothetical protein
MVVVAHHGVIIVQTKKKKKVKARLGSEIGHTKELSVELCDAAREVRAQLPCFQQ